MTPPDQEIPEAREAAIQVFNKFGMCSSELLLPNSTVSIISTACREYAKREHQYLEAIVAGVRQANDDLKQQLSSLQKENEELIASHQDDIEERTEALIKAVSRAEKAEMELDEACERYVGVSGRLGQTHHELTTLRNDVKPLIGSLQRAEVGTSEQERQLQYFLSKHPELK